MFRSTLKLPGLSLSFYRFMLKDYNTSEPIWFGGEYQWPGYDSYMEGAGYVLSKESVKRFVTLLAEGDNEKEPCCKNVSIR